METSVWLSCAANSGKPKRPGQAVLDLVIPTADSLLEVVANTAFPGRPVCPTQVEIPGMGKVDFLLEGFLVVETDGESHLEPRR